MVSYICRRPPKDDYEERKDRKKKELRKGIVISLFLVLSFFLFQRFIPEITSGPATLLHKGCAKGPYRISTAGGSGGFVGGPPFTCGCCCA